MDTERAPERPPSERSDRIPHRLSEGSGTRRRDPIRDTTEVLDDAALPVVAQTDAMMAAFRRALEEHDAEREHEERERINAAIRRQVKTLSENELTQALTLTNGKLRRMRNTAIAAGFTLIVALASYATERLTARSVADRTAEVAVEKTAERVEEVATKAQEPIAEAKQTVDAAAAERKALADELVELRAELAALREEKKAAKPKKKGSAE